MRAAETVASNDRGAFDPSDASRVADAINNAHRLPGGAAMATAVSNAQEVYKSAVISSQNVFNSTRALTVLITEGEVLVDYLEAV